MGQECADGGEALLGTQSRLVVRRTASLVDSRTSPSFLPPSPAWPLSNGVSPVPGRDSSMHSRSDSFRKEVRAHTARARTAPALCPWIVHAQDSLTRWLFSRRQSIPHGTPLPSSFLLSFHTHYFLFLFMFVFSIFLSYVFFLSSSNSRFYVGLTIVGELDSKNLVPRQAAQQPDRGCCQAALGAWGVQQAHAVGDDPEVQEVLPQVHCGGRRAGACMLGELRGARGWSLRMVFGRASQGACQAAAQKPWLVWFWLHWEVDLAWPRPGHGWLSMQRAHRDLCICDSCLLLSPSRRQP